MNAKVNVVAMLMVVVVTSAPLVAGTITGRVFNLNGTVIQDESIAISAYDSVGRLRAQTKTTSGKFTIRFPGETLNAADVGIILEFARRGQVTRRIVGLVGNSDRTQVLDVTVPKPKKPTSRCCPRSRRHPWRIRRR